MSSDTITSPAPPAISRGDLRKIAFASLIGTTIEWYDFFIYGVAASLIFNQLFFPALSPASGTLVSVATIGVAFVARPIGGIIFGHIGDRIGRKKTLVTTLLISGIATMLIGFLPTYETIGVVAPILLVIIRFAQGIGLAGEWGGAVLMAAEHAPQNRRGFYAGWPQMGVAIGVILANGLFLILAAVLPEGAFQAWGWRIPFLASVVLIGVGLFIRLRVMESPVFTALERTGARAKSPMLDALKRKPGTLVLATLAILLNLVAFYVLMTFMLSYTTSTLGMDRTTVLTGVLISAVVLAIGTLVASGLSDRFGRKRVILFFYISWLVFAFPLFWLTNTANGALVGLAISVGMLLTSAYGPIAAFLAELFPPQYRYSGMSLSFQVAAVLGGGLAPIGAVALAGTGLGYIAVALLIIVAAAISISAMLALKEPNKNTFSDIG
jgi:MFS family permease